MTDEVCGAEKDDGTTCGSGFGLCPDCGHCFTHCPHREEERQRARSRGGESTARKRSKGHLSPGDLPPLDSPQAAEIWLEAVGRAVALGRLGHQEGNAIIRAVKEWTQVRESSEVAESVEEIRDALAAWKRTGDTAPLMKVVE